MLTDCGRSIWQVGKIDQLFSLRRWMARTVEWALVDRAGILGERWGWQTYWEQALRNELMLFLASKRFLKRRLEWMLPEFAYIDYADISMRVYLSLKDMRGPSYHLLHRQRRFMDYEEQNRSRALSVMQAAQGEPVFLDIGSNIGLFSTLVAKKLPQARVFSFDPDPVSYMALTNTKIHNRLINLEIVPVGLGEKTELLSFYFDPLNHGGHSFDRSNINSGGEPIRSSLVCLQLDSLLPTLGVSRVDLMKVDVQGFEAQVLKGAAETIRRFRPVLLVECEHKYLAEPGSALPGLLTDYVCESTTTGERFAVKELAAKAQSSMNAGRTFSDIWFFPKEYGQPAISESSRPQ